MMTDCIETNFRDSVRVLKCSRGFLKRVVRGLKKRSSVVSRVISISKLKTRWVHFLIAVNIYPAA